MRNRHKRNGSRTLDHVEALILVQLTLMLPEAAKAYRGGCMPIKELTQREHAPESPTGDTVTDQVLEQLRALRGP